MFNDHYIEELEEIKFSGKLSIIVFIILCVMISFSLISNRCSHQKITPSNKVIEQQIKP